MRFTIDIPDEEANRLLAAGVDPARIGLEAVALEGYRNRQLFGGDLRRMLGFETPMEVNEFLDQHGVDLNYDLEEFRKDMVTLDKWRKEEQPHVSA